MVKDYVGYVMLVGQLREGWRYQIDDYDNDFDEDYNYDNENRHNNNGDRKKTGHSQLHKGLFGQNVWAFSTGKYNRDTHTLYIKNMINIL